ncbi:MAG: polyprenyl synthetase family protein [Deltaproteobacteria bacterium]|nr:polyprenyl synthetase family protein [Deltaproteobacteria bacterium]
MKELKERILGAVAGDLAEIEEALRKGLDPYLSLVSDVAQYILFSGGKRIRPLLMVLSARLCGYKGNGDKAVSVMFEYLHAATLLHDDVVDGADIRRGKKVSHSIWGNPTTVLVGDFLLAKTISTAADTGRVEVVKIMTEATAQMSEGEIHQLLNKQKIDMDEAEYTEIIRRKTTCLIQAACRVGAILANASGEKKKAMSDYGYNLGIAFQMVDDLLDYTADTKVLGKSIGSDLREGKMTLPVIYALNNADGKVRKRMEEIIRDRASSDSALNEMVGYLEKYGGLAYTANQASRHINKAKENLALFEDCETKRILTDLADYTIKRKA